MRQYAAIHRVPVTIGDKDYILKFTFGKIKRIRDQYKIDLLSTSGVALDLFTKILFAGLEDPGDLTEEKLDDLIGVQQIPYYIETLQLALLGQTQPSEATKNVSSASGNQQPESAAQKEGPADPILKTIPTSES